MKKLLSAGLAVALVLGTMPLLAWAQDDGLAECIAQVGLEQEAYEAVMGVIDECIAQEPKNHGQFVSCVAEGLNALEKGGTITGKHKGACQSCAARADIPAPAE